MVHVAAVQNQVQAVEPAEEALHPRVRPSAGRNAAMHDQRRHSDLEQVLNQGSADSSHLDSFQAGTPAEVNEYQDVKS